MTPALIRTLIVDDEPLARDGLRHLLTGDPDVSIVAECSNGMDALDILSRGGVDLVFLDVQMPEMTGLQMLDHLAQRPWPAIVFVTAFDQYALEAFRVHALDYLLKPFTDDQFRETLERAKSILLAGKVADMTSRLNALMRQLSQGRDGPFVARLAIQAAGRTEFVRTANIDWIEAADYYVEIHAGSKTHLLRETMNNLEDQLDPARFVRIHRSTIVNMDRIQAMEPFFKGDYCVVLKDGKKLKVSKNRVEKLKQSLTSPM